MPRAALLILFALALAGCERGFPTTGSEPTITEDEFVETMGELRTTTMGQEGGVLPEARRDEILQRRGLEPEDLVRFAEVHGPDVPYMLGVWTRVDSATAAESVPEIGEGTGGTGEGTEP